MKINIAIDGTSAVGKSSIADILAKELDYIHLDTGAMYRAVGYLALEKDLSLDDEESIASIISQMNLQMGKDGSVKLNGEDITEKIRHNDIAMAASSVSKLFKVREALVSIQQRITKEGGYIVDGRDIGTVVLKDAPVKLFLTASSETRAKRRYLQDKEKGIVDDYQQLLKEIELRDYQDTHRQNSPLKKADDAIEIDTSCLSLEQVASQALEIINGKLGNK